MGTTKLIIRKNRLNEAGKTPIYVQYCYNQKTSLFSTGEKIEPIHWNAKEQKARKTLIGFNALNSSLMVVKERIDNAVREAYFNGNEPTISYVKRIINEKSEKRQLQGLTFFEVYQFFIKSTEGLLKKSTLKTYRTVEKHLRNFESLNRGKLSFDKIDDTFYISFKKFLIFSLGHTNNTVGKYVKTLKTFLGFATKLGVTNNNSFRKFKVDEEETNIKFLTEDELSAIEQLDLTKKKKLSIVRDMFCLTCYTGLRFSDLKSLKPEHIKKRVYGMEIEINMIKTKTTVIIPLNDKAINILNNYDGFKRKLPIYSNQKSNDYIKEICFMANINSQITTVHFQGSKRIEKSVQKYNLISNHSGRHTFATLSLENGMRIEVLQKILGHKSIKTTMKYVRITDNVKAEEMNRAWNKPQLKLVS